MKNILLVVLIISLFCVSCGASSGLSGAEVNLKPVPQKTYTEIPVTPESLGKPFVNGKNLSFVTKKELIESIVSLNTGGKKIILTPVVKATQTTEHQNGAIIRKSVLEGGNPLTVYDESGWSIIKTTHATGKDYPTSITAKIKGEKGIEKCIKFEPDSGLTGYYPVLQFKNGKAIETDAGYEYMDACSNTLHYASFGRFKLGFLFLEERVEDTRVVKETRGLALPGRVYNKK